MSHPLLLSHLPFTTSTSSSSFTLPSTTTPEQAAQSGQHDLLQEYPVHHQPLQEHPGRKASLSRITLEWKPAARGKPAQNILHRMCSCGSSQVTWGGLGEVPLLLPYDFVRDDDVSDVWDRQYKVSGVDNVFVTWLFGVQLIHWRACDTILWLDYIRCVVVPFRILWILQPWLLPGRWSNMAPQEEGMFWTLCSWQCHQILFECTDAEVQNLVENYVCSNGKSKRE